MDTILGPCGECYNCICLRYHMTFTSDCCAAPVTTGRFIDGKPISDEEVTKRLRAVRAKQDDEAASKKATSRWNQIQFRDVCNNCGSICTCKAVHKREKSTGANNCFVVYQSKDGIWYGWNTTARSGTSNHKARILYTKDAVQGNDMHALSDALLSKYEYAEYGMVVATRGVKKTTGSLPEDGTPISIVEDIA